MPKILELFEEERERWYERGLKDQLNVDMQYFRSEKQKWVEEIESERNREDRKRI